MTNFEKVAEFMKAGEQDVATKLTFPNEATRGLRLELIAEELEELVYATLDNDIVEIADALTDLLYVIYGAGHAYGIDLDACFEEVHKSNMTKFEDGKAVKNADGKIVKGKNYRKPNLNAVLARCEAMSVFKEMYGEKQ